MYAILKSGGKQYRVKAGDSLKVEKLDQALGAEVELTDVLLVGGAETFIGTPVLDNAKVTAVVAKQARKPKIIVLKKKRRQGYRKLQGHRQDFTELFIKAITSPNGEVSKADGEAKVYDPANKPAPASSEEKKAAPKVAKAKKKATKKKAATKKKTAKKKTAKKKATKKKATKKAATKKK